MLAVLLLLPVASFAQESKVAVVDFERAVVGSAAGQNAATSWNNRYTEVQQSLESRQKEIEDTQNRLRTQSNVLSEAVKAEMTRDIERKTTELNRASEDAQRDMEELRASLLQPITAVAQAALQAYSREMGFTLIIDISNPQGGVVYWNPGADVTDELIKRIDAQVPATPAAPATTAPAPSPQ
jgi:Skp family chaperone for outer membrane proteins